MLVSLLHPPTILLAVRGFYLTCFFSGSLRALCVGDLDTVNGTIILSLLLHLNRQESITCIMVTHDTALKHYAHRVVHMVDGKVARIETIDPKVRQEMDDNLKIKVQQVSKTEHSRCSSILASPISRPHLLSCMC